MRKVAILTTDKLEDFFVYDHMLEAPLRKLGWESIEVSWHTKNHNWDQYDAVVVRSTWDYQAHCDDRMFTNYRELICPVVQFLIAH